MPLLVEKFKRNLARRFSLQRQNAILELCLDARRLERTPVNGFSDLLSA
jgi:2-methylcitrate dehydratase